METLFSVLVTCCNATGHKFKLIASPNDKLGISSFFNALKSSSPGLPLIFTDILFFKISAVVLSGIAFNWALISILISSPNVISKLEKSSWHTWGINTVVLDLLVFITNFKASFL